MPVRAAWRPPGGAIRPAHEDIWRFAPTACYWSLSFEPVVFTYCRLCGWGLKHMRCGYRGAGWPRIRMTEVIYPCSSEQPERRFVESGFIYFWQPRAIFPHLPAPYLRLPEVHFLRSICGRGRGGGVGWMRWTNHQNILRGGTPQPPFGFR